MRTILPTAAVDWGQVAVRYGLVWPMAIVFAPYPKATTGPYAPDSLIGQSSECQLYLDWQIWNHHNFRFSGVTANTLPSVRVVQGDCEKVKLVSRPPMQFRWSTVRAFNAVKTSYGWHLISLAHFVFQPLTSKKKTRHNLHLFMLKINE